MSSRSKDFVGKIKKKFQKEHNGLSATSKGFVGKIKGHFTAHNGLSVRSNEFKNVQILCDLTAKVTDGTYMSMIFIDRSYKCHGDLKF